MSRWLEAANTNPFRPVWTQLLSSVDEIILDDSTELSIVQEGARLKKILNLIDQILINADAELIPVNAYSQWSQVAQSCLQQVQQFKLNKNVGHLSNANGNADSIFIVVRPYMLISEQGLTEFGEALKSHTEKVTSYVLTFEQSAKKSQSALSIANGEAIAQKKRIDEIEVRAKGFDDYLFLAEDGKLSTESRVKGMVDKAASDQKAIAEFYEKLLSGPDSISQLIGGNQRDIDQIRQKLTELANLSEQEHDDLRQFYHRIFGYHIGGDNKNEIGGLKHEVDERIKQLALFEAEHEKRHNAMFDRVESLLPGATSAGLATAYKSLKESFNTPIKNYTKAFYGSLVFLLLSGLFMIFDFSSSPFKIELVKAHEWTEMLRTLLVRAPVVIPVVWFAVFSATRRSQYERLQQEYAHKEALASSYEGYKKQLQDLQVEAEDLQKELIAKSINAIAYNASVTLDGKHTEKPPVFQMLEKLNADELKKLIELVRGK